MAEVLCPACGEAREPRTQVRNIAVCGACGASLVVQDDGSAVRAVAADTQVLTQPELSQLVRARASVARPERRRR